ncbi:lipopolysaccharide A protein [Aliivibrio fischeri]|uniref:glycosyl transferase family 90 n=1 Tax=Aliivibrio fischeri TaxID=668 RepID=UPI00107E7AB0|nr:glycosyl transferase family 90 [Aliivibrio fischeri]TGA73311.1 lipopolysaccharide A protein [Aliivibrio fischeri]
MSLKKFRYYVANGSITIIPAFILQALGKKTLQSRTSFDQDYIEQRVNYYNKLDIPFSVNNQEATQVSQFKKTGGSAYYLDLFKVIKAFSPSYFFNYINGDVIDVPAEPSFLKSRPIDGDNAASILLKLNAIRHYNFINDNKSFQEKKDAVVWRGTGFRPNRRLLLSTHFNDPKCNIGRVDTKDNSEEQLGYVLPSMSIEEQLEYKFILSLEGMDVATNLKWIMSSNSLCFTPKLRYETWFMEGKLQAGIHFVEVKDDFSDLIEKMDYYTKHEDEALEIIKNANQWVEQFKDSKREKLISLLVAQKYFDLSGQSSAKN